MCSQDSARQLQISKTESLQAREGTAGVRYALGLFALAPQAVALRATLLPARSAFILDVQHAAAPAELS